jgi:hypothetical protein
MCAFAGLKIPYYTNRSCIPNAEQSEMFDEFKEHVYTTCNTPLVYPWGRPHRNLFFIGPFELKDQQLPFGV